MNYSKKYKKYKLKYKQEKLYNDILFIHNCLTTDNLISILQSGEIKPGINLTEKHTRLSGFIKSNFIHFNIHFNNFKTKVWNIGIVFSGKIFQDFDIIFNKGWNSKPNEESIIIKKNSNINDKYKYINIIQKYVQDNFEDLFNHEILINGIIPIHKYLKAVICLECSDEICDEITELIKKYDNIKLIKKLKDNIIF